MQIVGRHRSKFTQDLMTRLFINLFFSRDCASPANLKVTDQLKMRPHDLYVTPMLSLILSVVHVLVERFLSECMRETNCAVLPGIHVVTSDYDGTFDES